MWSEMFYLHLFSNNSKAICNQLLTTCKSRYNKWHTSLPNFFKLKVSPFTKVKVLVKEKHLNLDKTHNNLLADLPATLLPMRHNKCLQHHLLQGPWNGGHSQHKSPPFDHKIEITNLCHSSYCCIIAAQFSSCTAGIIGQFKYLNIHKVVIAQTPLWIRILGQCCKLCS